MGFKRRYKRIRFYFSWKYPGLYQMAQVLAFPVQALAVCLMLYLAVGFYQKHYSFEANMRNHQPVVVDNVDNKGANPAETSLPISPAPVDSTENPVALPVTNKLSTRSGTTDSINVVAIGKPENITPLNTPETTVEKQPEAYTSRFQLQTGEWLLKQDNSSFILQLAASTNQSELKKFAQEMTLPSPVAMYPFKKNPDGSLLYGLSSGLYDSSTAALEAMATLPKGAGRYGTWVRKVSVIKPRVTELTKNQIDK